MGSPEGNTVSNYRGEGQGLGWALSLSSVLIMLKNNGRQAHVFLTAVVGSQAAGFTPSSFPPNLPPQRGLPESQDGVSTIILGSENFS